MNDYIKKRIIVFFIAVLVFGFYAGILGAGASAKSGSNDLGKRLEQVNSDLGAAIQSQREAGDRAARLQEELRFVTEYARILEEGSGKLAARTDSLEARAGNLSDQLSGIESLSGELTSGIIRAQDSLEESRILLDELGTVLRGLPGGS